MDLAQFESRKRSHLQHALDARSQATGFSGLESVHLVHCALPELDFADIHLDTPFPVTPLPKFPKRKLATPFFISGMTAGHTEAPALNRLLSRAAARRGWIFGVGSQRRELAAELQSVDAWTALRAEAPGLVMIGNLGLSQFTQLKAGDFAKLVKGLQADAFAIHLNALQEALQPEGTPQFRGGFSALKKAAHSRKVPLIVKETGCGFSARVLKRLRALPLAAIDVSGMGGTHWGRIEGARAEATGHSIQAGAAEVFRNWGISTVQSVILARAILRPGTEIWASGGVRNGLDAARLIALGAHRVGFARPALEAALAGEESLEKWMEEMEFQLRVALFSSGYATPEKLRKLAQKNGDVIHAPHA